jgi:hypothetical protein
MQTTKWRGAIDLVSAKRLALGASISSGKDGGGYRHEQIRELAERSGLPVVPLPEMGRLRGHLDRALFGFLLMRARHPRLGARTMPLLPTAGLSCLLCAGIRYLNARAFLSSESIGCVLIETCHLGGQGEFLAARERGLPVVALPHNIDSWVRPYHGVLRKLWSLRSEMALLSLADAAFSIAATDSWLHAQWSVKSQVLSYFPARARRDQLLALRRRRQVEPGQRRFLIAGTATNKPTLLGMLALAEALSKQAWPAGTSFEFVGRGTENLRGRFPGLPMAVHGRLADEAFEDLLCRCAGAVVHQEGASGALTRVLELVTAGLPVLANRVGRREWESLPGAWGYDDWAALRELLLRPLPTPDAPEERAGEVQRFWRTLRSLSGAEKILPQS